MVQWNQMGQRRRQCQGGANTCACRRGGDQSAVAAFLTRQRRQVPVLPPLSSAGRGWIYLFWEVVNGKQVLLLRFTLSICTFLEHSGFFFDYFSKTNVGLLTPPLYFEGRKIPQVSGHPNTLPPSHPPESASTARSNEANSSSSAVSEHRYAVLSALGEGLTQIKEMNNIIQSLPFFFSLDSVGFDCVFCDRSLPQRFHKSLCIH